MFVLLEGKTGLFRVGSLRVANEGSAPFLFGMTYPFVLAIME
jgi:hypothetical protein